MPIPKRKLREIIFQWLYSYDFDKDAISEDRMYLFMNLLHVSKKVMYEVEQYSLRVIEKIDEIDKKISQASESYVVDRIHRVELNILRLGAYEICYDSNIPAKVSIAEAIRLTRKFSTAEAANFVNAVLDHIYKNCKSYE